MPARTLSRDDLDLIKHLVPPTLEGSRALWLDQERRFFAARGTDKAVYELYGDRKPCLFKGNVEKSRAPIALEGGVVDRWVTYWEFDSISELLRVVSSAWWYGDFYIFSEPLVARTRPLDLGSAGAVTKHLISDLGESSFLYIALEFGGEILFYPADLQPLIDRAVLNFSP